VKTLMKRMGIEALYRRPRTTKPEPGHKIYPYLLRGMRLSGRTGVGDGHHVHPMGTRLCLSGRVLDWFSRRVLSWGVSITMEAASGVETLEDALARHGKPDIFIPTRVRSSLLGLHRRARHQQHLRSAWTVKGAWRDNVFVERLWRRRQIRGVYLRAYESVFEARTSSGRYWTFIMAGVHTPSLDGTTPDQAYSPRCHSAWQPNPGRGSHLSTRKNLFQTTGTTSRYLRNLEVNQIAPFSLGGVAAVGHVAIIEVDSDNQPWIIEALWAPGVVRQRLLILDRCAVGRDRGGR